MRVAKKLATRGVDAAILNEMKEIDAKRRDILVKVENLKAERNTVSAEIAQAKRNKENADDKIAAMQTLSAEVKALDAELAEIDAKLTEFTTTLPNIPADSVPVGADEDENGGLVVAATTSLLHAPTSLRTLIRTFCGSVKPQPLRAISALRPMSLM